MTSEAKLKLTMAQLAALKTISRRDWPAGEPRRRWIGAATLRVILAAGLVTEREGSAVHGTWHNTPILDLTEAGHVALADGTMATKPPRTQTR